jgi:hypothetical protein
MKNESTELAQNQALRQPPVSGSVCEHKSVAGGGIMFGDKKHCLDCGKEIPN